MPTWSHPLGLITEIGRPYLLKALSPESPSAFVVRVQSAVHGSVAHPAGDFLVAFGAACPHMGCPLVRKDDGVVVHEPASAGKEETLLCGPCPCHGTTFDLSLAGLVVLGPSTQNLPQLRLVVDQADNVVRSEGWLGSSDPRTDTWPLIEGE